MGRKRKGEGWKKAQPFWPKTEWVEVGGIGAIWISTTVYGVVVVEEWKTEEGLRGCGVVRGYDVGMVKLL